MYKRLFCAVLAAAALLFSCTACSPDPAEAPAAPSTDPVVICGRGLSEYSLVYDENLASTWGTVAALLKEKTGIELPVNDDALPALRLTVDPSVAARSYSARVENRELVFRAGSKYGLSLALEQFLSVLPEDGQLTVDEGYTLDGSYEMPSFTEGCEDCGHYILIETDKDPLSYRTGDTIVVTATPCVDGEPAYAPYIMCAAENAGSYRYECLDATSGSAVFETTAEKSGTLLLDAAVCDENKGTISALPNTTGGVIVDYETVTALRATPEGFDEFWDRQTALLYSVEPTATLTRSESLSDSDWEVYDVELSAPGARPVKGYLTYPADSAPGSLKARVLYHGYAVYSAYPVYTPGYITLMINAHGIENGQPQEYYDALRLEGGELFDFGFDPAENADPDTAYFRDMLLRAAQAVRYIKTREEWNGADLELSGASMGGFQVVGAALLCREEGITHMELAAPWMCDHTSALGWHPTDAGLDVYDMLYMAQRIDCESISVIAGLGDPICPADGIFGLYRALPNGKTITYGQFNAHSGNPKVYCPDYTLEN